MVEGEKVAKKDAPKFDKTCPTCFEEYEYKIDPKTINTVDFEGFDGTVCVNTYWFVHEPGADGE